MIKVKCEYCGKEFETYPYILKKNKNLFCSSDCYHKSLYKNNQIIQKDSVSYIKLQTRNGKEYFAIIDSDDIDKVSKFSWYLHCGKYVRSTEKIMLHRLIMNCPDDRVVDHINHNTLDNRKTNLRICTAFGNCQNIITNKSGKPGVYKDRTGKWCSRIKIDGKNIHIGRFDSFEKAKFAREEAEIKYMKYEA